MPLQPRRLTTTGTTSSCVFPLCYSLYVSFIPYQSAASVLSFLLLMRRFLAAYSCLFVRDADFDERIFVLNDESLTDAVKRELKEEAGIKVNYLEQLYTFGDDVKRDPRDHTVSVAYFALVNPKKWTLKADTDAEDAQWFPISKVPKLAYDHKMKEMKVNQK